MARPRTATRPSRPATCTSPTARSTTGCGASTEIFAYTFEMYPTDSNPGFYPPDEVIAAQTARNREAVLRLLEIADCPYRAIGKEAQYCGLPTATVFADDFETARGWTAGTTGATAGRFERGDPEATDVGRAQAARHDGQRRQRPRHRPPGGRHGRRARRRRRRHLDHVAVDRAEAARLRAELLVLPCARQQLVVGRLPAGEGQRADRAARSSARRTTTTAPGRRRPWTSPRSPARAVQIVVEAADLGDDEPRRGGDRRRAGDARVATRPPGRAAALKRDGPAGNSAARTRVDSPVWNLVECSLLSRARSESHP